jgi:hypothetical protein
VSKRSQFFAATGISAEDEVGAALRGRQPLLHDDGMIEIYRRENTIPKRQRRAAARADEDRIETRN